MIGHALVWWSLDGRHRPQRRIGSEPELANAARALPSPDRYAEEGARDEHWFRDGVRKYFRRLDTLINGVIGAGLTIDQVVEPLPTSEQLREHPEWSAETKRPMFLLVRASKPVR